MRIRSGWVLSILALLGSLTALTASARAAGPPEPEIAAAWVTEVTATSAKLRAEIDANGLATTFRFEYLSEAAYRGNLGAEPPWDGFQGAAWVPANGAGSVGAETVPVRVFPQQIAGLTPLTAYRYRVVASNSAGTAFGPARPLRTEAPTNVFSLLDGRGWELVSPVDKDGGAISLPEAIFGGGAFQAAAGGGAVTYGSSSSFAGGDGSPRGEPVPLDAAAPAVGRRRTSPCPRSRAPTATGPTGRPLPALLRRPRPWAAAERGSLPRRRQRLPGRQPAAARLRRAGRLPGLLPARSGRLGSRRCSAAPDLAATSLGPGRIRTVGLAGATPDLGHVVLSSCAALTADAIEVAAAGRLRPIRPESLPVVEPGGLSLLNLLPGDRGKHAGRRPRRPESGRSPPTARASTGPTDGNLYLREGAADAAGRRSGGGRRGLPGRRRERRGRLLHQSRPSLPLRRRDRNGDRPHPGRGSGGRARRLRRRLPRLLPHGSRALRLAPEAPSPKSQRGPARRCPATTRRPPAPPGSAPTAPTSPSSPTPN